MTHPAVTAHMKEIGRKGGEARAKALSKERASEIGKKAVAAREAKKAGRIAAGSR